MRTKQILPVALSLVLAALAACAKSGEATGSACPTGSTLTYETFGRSFMEANCTKCHSPSGEKNERPRLDSITSIRTEIASIDRTSAAGPNATNTEMPEDEDVSEADRKKLGEWLACGAP